MSSLEELASVISSKSSKISSILKENSIPHPSFNEASFADFEEIPGRNVYQESLRVARNELISAAQDIIHLAMGPIDHLLSLAWSATDAANLGVVTQFQIPQKIPVGSAASIKDLAASTGLPEEILARTVRYAIANGIFREPEAGLFAHSAASAALARNPKIHAVALYSTHVISSILVKMAESLKAIQKDGAPAAAFNVAYPEYEDIFEYFRMNPDVATEYVTYLNGRADLSRWNIIHLTTAWDWAALGSKTVVDVGGSAGHSCFALALKAPRAKFIIQDLSIEALKKGYKMASANPDLQRRVTFTKHDFFTTQPVTADVYFFRHILHDWSDADSVRILRALLPALKDGAKVLINEGIMPDPPIARANTLDDKEILIEDQFMLGGHFAKERSVVDFIGLFKQASDKFHYIGVTGGGSGAFQSLLEFVYGNVVQ